MARVQGKQQFFILIYHFWSLQYAVKKSLVEMELVISVTKISKLFIFSGFFFTKIIGN